MLTKPALLSLVAVVLVPALARADATGHARHGDDATHHATDHVAVFAGVTHVEAENAATIGIDYDHRLGLGHGLVGVGVIVDLALLDEGTHAQVMPEVSLHPFGGMRLVGAVGWAHGHAHDDVVVRGGAGYDVHLGRLSVGPEVDVDRARGTTAVVVGLAVGAGF